MPISRGLVRNRAHHFGRQLAPGTNVAATRRYPFSGVPEHSEFWEDPEIDTGSRHLTATPHRIPPEPTADLEFPRLAYNDLPIIFSGFFGGDVAPTGGGTAKTWSWDPESETVDDPDLYTYEFGEADIPEDWFQYGNGIIESFEITGPVGLGPLTATVNWRFGSIKSTGSTDYPVDGTVPTPGLSVSTTDVIVYLKDGAIFIGDTPYDLEANQISNALYAFTLRGEQEVDMKRWANGTQSFDTDEMIPVDPRVSLEARWGKTSDIVGTGSESDDWMAESSVLRYVRMEFISTELAQSPSTYYGFVFEGPMRYKTRTEDAEGGNSIVVLTGDFYYDPNDFGGFFRPIVINTLTEAELGLAGS